MVYQRIGAINRRWDRSAVADGGIRGVDGGILRRGQRLKSGSCTAGKMIGRKTG